MASKNKGGRPTKYNEKYHTKLVKALALNGMVDVQIADVLEITEKTLNNWKNKYPEFLQSLNDGKHDPNKNVQNALYERALGYAHVEDKIFINSKTQKPIIVPTIKHYPPDTAACFIWLKNRDKLNWTDKQEVEHSGIVEYKINPPPKYEDAYNDDDD